MEPLFRGVYLMAECPDGEEATETMRTALRHVLPLFAARVEIDTVFLLDQRLLLELQSHLPLQQFFGIKQLILYVKNPSAVNDTLILLLHQWLGTRLANNEPRLVQMVLGDNDNDDIPMVLGLLVRIRQVFFPFHTPFF
jgi:hypothetical protein